MPSLMSLSSFALLTPPTFNFKPTTLPPNPSLPYLSITCSSDNNPKPTRSSSWVSPDWLTSLSRSLTMGQDDSGIPMATAKLDDVSELLGGALFLPLFRWMNMYGPIYRLAAGPRNFVVVSDPAIAKHVLRNYGKYAKGLVAEVSEFLFGSGFAIAEGELWTVRRRAVVPSLHKRYLSIIVDRVFCKCAERLVENLRTDALNGSAVNMEEKFSQLTLDVIGLSVFNYNFDSLTADSPVIDAVYTALKEAEARSTDLLPYWKVKALCKIIPRQIKAEESVTVIRKTVEELIAKCKEIVEREGERIDEDEYVNDSDPSILRFLLASREEVSSVQLRDDLLSMLVAGHETTGSVLTWTLYLLSKNSSSLMKAQEEVDRVLQGRSPSYEDIKDLKFLTRCINESMRLYPHPPVLIRRAKVADVLPGNYKVNAGQDIMISVYNIHHSSQVWERAEDFLPERFDLEGPVPNETNTDFRFIPFSGGPRKCVGDQFALLEAIVALAIFVQHMNFELVPDQNISMTTGATIHTTNGLYMKLTQRQIPSAFVPTSSRWKVEGTLLHPTKAKRRECSLQKEKEAVMEDETLESRNQARLAILELTNMISVPMCLHAIVRLNVPDAIWQGGSNAPLSASQILTRVLPSGDPHNLQRILRLLTTYGVFAEHLLTDPSSDQVLRKYSLTDIGKTLVTDADGLSYGAYVLQHYQEELMTAWPLVHEAVVDSTTEPFVKANGEPAYSYYGKKPEMNDLMQRAMSGVSVPFMKAILNGYNGFDGLQRLVDVGGSAGDCLRMILQKHTNIKEGINFDLPEVVAKAPDIPGVTHVGGDMFKSVPDGDAIFMKWVLTTWTDEECKLIMKNCYNALPVGGKMIACEPVLPKESDNSLRTRALLEGDIFVMTIYRAKGKHRTEEEFRQLGLSAGFPHLQAFYIDYFYTVLEFQK